MMVAHKNIWRRLFNLARLFWIFVIRTVNDRVGG
jgi:hypothetical protein